MYNTFKNNSHSAKIFKLVFGPIYSLIDILVCDASFISLTKILPEPIKLCSKKAKLIALIKPQFELEKKFISKGGIVKDEQLRNNVCLNISSWMENKMYLRCF